MSYDSEYGKIPHDPKIPVQPFTAHVSDNILEDLKQRLKQAIPPRKIYENTTSSEQLGVKRDWLVDAIEHWKTFDWRKTEAEINSYPNFTGKVDLDGREYDIHFVALFSQKKDAIPLVMLHGWPGSFLEFMGILKHLTKTYTPATLPVHVIVPSLIGYGYSSPPPVDIDFQTKDCAPLIDKLMVALGLTGYVAQGGDIGSFVSRHLGESFDACAGVHLNFMPTPTPEGFQKSSLDEFDKKCFDKSKFWDQWETAYVMEHATKTGTIAAVCESSPVALLAWIGEKFIVWSDETPPMDTILSDITLYWITNTFATSLYHYRCSYGKEGSRINTSAVITEKPLGYTQCMFEILPSPASWVKAKNNLVWHRRHEHGGHFAALEKPEMLWDDVWDFISKHVAKS